jgi:MFS family permease
MSRRAGGTGAAWPSAFHALWVGQTVSSVGSQLSLVAIPLVAALALQAGPGEMAVLGALETAPFVVLVLPAGVIADTRDRRSLLILCDAGRAITLGAVVAAFAAGVGSLEWLCLAAVVVGGFSALFTVAQQAYLPEIVSEQELIRANQRLEVSDSGARVLGPGLAGVVVAAFGGTVALASDALSYVASAVAIGLIPPPRAPASSALPEEAGSGVRRGVRFVFADPALRWLLASTAIFNLGSGMMLAQLVLFATGDLGLGAAGFGAFQALGNAGFVVGALLVDRVVRRLGTPAVHGFSSVLGAVAMLLIAVSAVVGGIPLLLVGRFVGAFSVPLFNVTLVTVRQTRSPANLRARVAATYRAIDWGTAPVGALASGIVGVAVGIPAVMAVAAIVGLASIPVAVLGVAAAARQPWPVAADLHGLPATVEAG